MHHIKYETVLRRTPKLETRLKLGENIGYSV